MSFFYLVSMSGVVFVLCPFADDEKLKNIHVDLALLVCERRGVTVTDSEPLDSASAPDPEFQMFIDRNGSHYNSSLFCHESLVSSHVPRLYHPR